MTFCRWSPKSNLFVLDPKWKFVPTLKKFPPSILYKNGLQGLYWCEGGNLTFEMWQLAQEGGKDGVLSGYKSRKQMQLMHHLKTNLEKKASWTDTHVHHNLWLYITYTYMWHQNRPRIIKPVKISTVHVFYIRLIKIGFLKPPQHKPTHSCFRQGLTWSVFSSGTPGSNFSSFTVCMTLLILLEPCHKQINLYCLPFTTSLCFFLFSSFTYCVDDV